LTTDFGGGSVTANGDSDGFYARYDQNNNLNSYLPLADPGYQYSEAAINNLGTVVVGGDFEPSINLGGTDYATDGGMAAFVSGFSATTRLWTFTVVGPGVESDVRLASDSSGNVYVAGTFQQSITIGGKTLTSAGGSDIFLVGLSPNGAVNWVRSFGGAGNDIAWRLASSPNGDLAIAGDFFATVDFGGGARTSAGGRDIFIATFRGSDGSYRWDHTYGGAIDDFGQSVVVDTDGSVFALATFGSTVSFGTHMFNPSAGDSALLHFAK
jgi:hypothetical protein